MVSRYGEAVDVNILMGLESNKIIMKYVKLIIVVPSITL